MRSFRTTLKRLLQNIWVVIIAVLAGWGTAALFHFTPLGTWIPDAGGIMVDAITGAAGSAITVYVIALTVQIDETRRAAQAGVADGIVGDIEIPNLRRLVQNEMMKLPHPGAGDSRAMFLVDAPNKFAKQIEKASGKVFESVALAVVVGEEYYAEVFQKAVASLTERFGAAFTHFVVLDADKNIIAAMALDRQDAWPLQYGDIAYVKWFLDTVKASGQQALQGLAILGFATLRFEVTNSPVELFRRFAEEKASEALLSFNGEIVVGMIQLWQLVTIALKRAASRT